MPKGGFPLSTLSVDADWASRYIESHVDTRQVNKIQHAFPSPRFWSETDVPVDQVLEDRRRLRSLGRGSVINLYVGVPYCIKTEPGKCGYCLFPVEDYVGNEALEEYFGYLKREAALYHEALQGQTLGAVYFGGGTSNLYKGPKYHELMELVRDLFPSIAPEVDLTLEGIPQLFSREKLLAIKEAGMNRISMGVQQINERLNALSGRKQTTKHVVQTLEWARELGLACNVDLIFGWPQQTVSTMVQDLERVISWGVYDITHYELNIGGPTDFALNRYHELPSTLSNLEMYRVSRDLFKSHGYEQVTAYNWRKPGDPASRRYEEGVTRRFDSMDTLGLGYAAITFFGDVALTDPISWSYINQRNLSQYKSAIDEGRFPVECGFRHEPEDFRLCMVFRNLFALELDRQAYSSAFGTDVYDEFAGVWSALEEWNFVTVTPEKISLTGDGPFYTPMIQALLAEKRYRALRERAAARTRNAKMSLEVV
jgi:oxygen-independent coproporphyrinogen-3 oxidase